jgi:hypothetical protein
MHRSSHETVSLLAALALTGTFAAAQDETEDSEPESVSVPGLAIEEIVVYREQTLNTLRLEVYRVEEAFYDAFNAANSNDEFDITCERQSPRSHKGSKPSASGAARVASCFADAETRACFVKQPDRPRRRLRGR